jgi:hypothetical protein
MKIRFSTTVLPALALSLSLGLAPAAHARTSVSFNVNLGTTPHWRTVNGTHVDQAYGPDYDLFRYGGRYYVYNDDRWYYSRRPSGRFTMINDSRVPREFARVSRDRWHHYPDGWMSRYGDRSRDRHDRY